MSQTNPRIKVLRVDNIKNKSDILEYGQPVYDKKTNRLLVGDGKMPESGSNLTGTEASKLTNTSDCWLNSAQSGKPTKLWVGSEAEYNSLTKDSNTLYFIKES